MGLKKYEIITVGSDKRVRALRSWAVGGRYVNIGDVGGIVYDEKTLSQDGLCWLFRGNFGFPGARIGGDSIVDVGEATLSTAGAPAVDILGSSVVVGSKLQFEARQTEADAVVLTAADFEQGTFASLAVGQKPGKDDSAVNFIRTKNPIFMGGKSITIKTPVPGYIITILVTDADGYIIKPYKTAITDDHQSIPTAAGQYAYIRLTKNPAGPTVPADATAARIAFTGTYETKLSIIDSRVEINPATSTGTLSLRPGGTYTMTPGAKYPDSVIHNSKVSMMVHATANRTITLMAEFINTNAVIDVSGLSGLAPIGIYKNVKNLTISGNVSGADAIIVRGLIQATDCDNFTVSGTSFPGEAAAKAANMPFIFQGCNVPGGRFPHDPRINNTYINIDFAKAQTDLNKVASDFYMCSSNVEGMYRLGTGNNILGCLVESHESVKSLRVPPSYSGYNTTIYKDAYFNGLFYIAGTNVFGSTKKHNTQDVSGCKIVNTGETAVNMKGNIRVEDNAILTNVNIIGTGYFGGNAVISGAFIDGCVYMRDNASFTKTAGTLAIRNLKMTENAYAVLGDYPLNGRIHLSDNARFTPTAAGLSGGDLVMKDNAVISGAVAVDGVITMKDNAKVSAGTLSAYGDITLCGSYNQTVDKSWTGKRTITDVNGPEYDNNVKSKYDF